jgi:hypothetical protein
MKSFGDVAGMMQGHARYAPHLRTRAIMESALRRWYINSMTNGQVVLVTTEPLGGGAPVRSVYFVAEEDPAKAEALVAAMMAPNERVEAWGPLPEAAVKALGIRPGDFMHG